MSAVPAMVPFGSAGRTALEAQPAPVAERPAIDLCHLRRFTLGDRLLEEEVLDLFEQQASDVVASLASATDRRDWAMAAHTIKGSARAVGAFEVATIAERLEAEGPAGGRTRQLIEEIEAALGRARRYIAANRQGGV